MTNTRNIVGRLAVIDKATNEFIGWCGPKYIQIKDENDLGFRLFRQYWNKGLATSFKETFGFDGCLGVIYQIANKDRGTL
jgi:RimJ/RimL family protein N-acetyltransferase